VLDKAALAKKLVGGLSLEEIAAFAAWSGEVIQTGLFVASQAHAAHPDGRGGLGFDEVAVWAEPASAMVVFHW
jgi:hypothetical protein